MIDINMANQFLKMKTHLAKTDPKIFRLIQKEAQRQKEGLNLIPSENYVSPAVLEAIGSVLTNKYSEGYPGRRYYSGHQFIDQIEEIANERAKKLFSPRASFLSQIHSNVQPHSGSQANAAVYLALLKPRDKILSMRLDCGGHLSHGSSISFSGKYYRVYFYGLDKKTGLIDFNQVEKIARRIKPKLIVCGYSSYPRKIDFKIFKEIAQRVGAYLLADVAHIAGLIVTGLHPHCFPYAQIVTSTTHKTLRGPRGGLILCQKEYAQIIDRAVFPGIQGGPHEHIIAAKAVCFKEASQKSFYQYQNQIIKNAQVLAQTLLEEGLDLVSNGTDNHLILIDLTKLNLGGELIQKKLEEVGIYVNKNVIPFDSRSPKDPSGIRIGTPALTTRGFREKEMKIVGQLLAQIIKNPYSLKVKREVKKKVQELAQAHPFFN